MKMLRKLNDSSVQSAVAGAIILILVANPFIFDQVNRLFTMILGTHYEDNRYLVLFVHSVVFALLMYYINKWILKRVFRALAK